MVDEQRNEAELRREFAAHQAAEEQSRAWRMARGQATAEDLVAARAGPSAGPPKREAWMTELPPERSAARAPV